MICIERDKRTGGRRRKHGGGELLQCLLREGWGDLHDELMIGPFKLGRLVDCWAGRRRAETYKQEEKEEEKEKKRAITDTQPLLPVPNSA